METGISRLNLAAPLFFNPLEDPDPFCYSAGSGELLFCFNLHEGNYLEFEPDKGKLLQKMVFGGRAAGNITALQSAGEKTHQLPEGLYLFAQKGKILDKEAVIDLAVEIQQEALWQRLLPGQKLYLRYLFEDGRDVTQLFRPYKEL